MFIREYDRFICDRPKQIIGGGVHPYTELLFISSGEFRIHWIGNDFKASGPALFILTPSSPHHIEQISPTLECWFIEVGIQNAEYTPSLENLRRWNLAQSNIDWNNEALYDMQATLQSLERMVIGNLPKKLGEIHYQLMACDIQKLLLQIDYYVTTALEPKVKSEEQLSPDDPQWSAHKYIYDLIRHMEDHYMQDISLDDLADLAGYTPSYIIRLFKEMTDLTPIQYLNELRMYAATSYLQSSEMSVQDIADSIGYPNIHYFSRMFKKRFGVSPTGWKKSHISS